MKTWFLTCVFVVMSSGGAFAQSEYAPEDFIDTDFTGEKFRDALDASERLKERVDVPTELKSVDWDRALIRLTLRDDDRRLHERELLKPIENNLLDWVPSPPDPLDNGGFTLGAFNGAPVPYHLNGHPDFERTYPWDK